MAAFPGPTRARLRANLDRVRTQIEAALDRSGRPSGTCQLLAVVKRVPDELVRALVELGQLDLGENRVQALHGRPEDLKQAARFHLIGHLQTNKARRAAAALSSFHALDSQRLAEILNREAALLERTLPVFLQINISAEPQKFGMEIDGAEALAIAVRDLPSLQVLGLMGMAAAEAAPTDTRQSFARLRELSIALRDRAALDPEASGLSMGMSGDFELAVEEGATVVRVGSKLFEELEW